MIKILITLERLVFHTCCDQVQRQFHNCTYIYSQCAWLNWSWIRNVEILVFNTSYGWFLVFVIAASEIFPFLLEKQEVELYIRLVQEEGCKIFSGLAFFLTLLTFYNFLQPCSWKAKEIFLSYFFACSLFHSACGFILFKRKLCAMKRSDFGLRFLSFLLSFFGFVSYVFWWINYIRDLLFLLMNSSLVQYI